MGNQGDMGTDLPGASSLGARRAQHIKGVLRGCLAPNLEGKMRSSHRKGRGRIFEKEKTTCKKRA